MELADETAHRGLAYVAAVQRQGHAMTVDELEEYLRQPYRRPGTPGSPERRVVTTKIQRDIAKRIAGPLTEALQPALRQLSANITKALEPHEEWIPGTPGMPGESITDWLSRLHWLRVEDGRVRTTALGDAMLAHLEQASLEEEIPVGVVLHQGDELATARVVQQIAEIGPCAVVDRYFSMDSLLPIVVSTEVEAVLMGSDAGPKLAGVETALGGLAVDRRFEVRKSDLFHDRFVIPPDGPVWALGTSFTGLARRLSIMVRIDDETMSGAIRREFQEAWDAAEVVAVNEPEPPAPEVEDVEPVQAEEPANDGDDTAPGDGSSEPAGNGSK